MRVSRVVLLSFLLVTTCYAQKAKPIVVQSPDGLIRGFLQTSTSGTLQYQIEWNGETFAAPGSIGLIVDGHHYGEAASLGTPEYTRIDETYPIIGIKDSALNRGEEVKVPFSEHGQWVGSIEARAYDDGFAWRIIFNGNGSRHVDAETSTWALPAGRVWFGERNNAWKLKSYAGEFISAEVDNLPHVSSQGPIQMAPLLIEVQKHGYELITEAALANYSGMRLEAIGDRKLRVNFTEGSQGFDVDGFLQTPWRVILLAKDLNELVNSDLITNLNPPPDPMLYSDTSYIRPGRSVWRWWSRETGTPEQEMEFVDYAASLGFEYTLVDDGWDNWPDRWRNMAAVCSYAESRGVGVFAWKDYKYLSSPTDDWRQLHDFFDHAQHAGLAGVKIDFLNAESKDRIDFEHAALKIAAQHRMMIDFHGLQKPTGERRTYPNEISSEAVRGIELNKMAEGPITSSHNAALPFTRFVVGPADYTPLSLTWPGETTWTQQVAIAILFTSPFLTIAEDPEFLLKSKDVEPALELIKSIPSTWDETRVLPQSSVGELAVIARRKGSVWYIGALNGVMPCNLTLDLSQFDEGRSKSEVLSSPEKRSFQLTELPISAKGQFHYKLKAGDGIVIRITPIAH
jgi:alpha-glucosidase